LLKFTFLTGSVCALIIDCKIKVFDTRAHRLIQH
jgi:hypothetical protein